MAEMYGQPTPQEMVLILSQRESRLEELAKEFPDMHPMEIRTVFDDYWGNHTEMWGSALDYANHGAGSKDLFATVYWLKAQLSKSDTRRYFKEDVPMPQQVGLFEYQGAK